MSQRLHPFVRGVALRHRRSRQRITVTVLSAAESTRPRTYYDVEAENDRERLGTLILVTKLNFSRQL